MATTRDGEVTLTLPWNHYQTVMVCLGKQPFEVVADIILEINRQAQPQAHAQQTQAQQMQQMPPGMLNGAGEQRTA